MSIPVPFESKVGLDLGVKASIERRIVETRDALIGPSPESALPGFLDLHTDVDACFSRLKRHLLETRLDSTDIEKAANGWIYRVSHRMAKVARRLAETLARKLGPADDRALQVAALALLYMGESVKCEVEVGRLEPYDYRGLHAIMKVALDGSAERTEQRFVFDGRPVACSIEALYFRALLLAKFASGNLTPRHIEILDGCAWTWMDALRSVREAPPGAALRADLDSSDGLRRGARPDGQGLSLYLPQAPFEAGYRAAIEELHAGRMVPASGIASEFSIEEVVTVLDVVRLGLRESRRDPQERTQRRLVGVDVEAFIGLTEIMARAFGTAAPSAASVDIVGDDPKHAPRQRAGRERDDPTGDIYTRVRRNLHWADESPTGLGLTGTASECRSIAVGDLIGIRRSPADPLLFGKVVRRVPSHEGKRVVLGLTILARSAQPITVSRPAGNATTPGIDLLFVPGSDSSGRHDGYLVPDRLYRDPGPFEVDLGADTYDFRFNRMRDRGRGWALAGFEITGTRQSPSP